MQVEGNQTHKEEMRFGLLEAHFKIVVDVIVNSYALKLGVVASRAHARGSTKGENFWNNSIETA